MIADYLQNDVGLNQDQLCRPGLKPVADVAFYPEHSS